MKFESLKQAYPLSLVYIDLFKNITSPLKYLGVHAFAYYLIKENKECIYLCDKQVWHDIHYQEEDGFDGLSRCMVFAENNIKKIIYTGNPNTNIFAPNKPMNGNRMFENNMWNSLYYYYKSSNTYESFNFFGTNNNDGIIDVYFRHENLFKKFIAYFKGNFKPVTKQLKQETLVPISIDSNFAVEVNKITQYPNKFILQKKQSGSKTSISFSDKELKVIDILLKGELCKNWYEKYNIKPTIYYNCINILKRKLGATNKQQLIKQIYRLN